MLQKNSVAKLKSWVGQLFIANFEIKIVQAYDM